MVIGPEKISFERIVDKLIGYPHFVDLTQQRRPFFRSLREFPIGSQYAVAVSGQPRIYGCKYRAPADRPRLRSR